MIFSWSLILLSLATGADPQPTRAGVAPKAAETSPKIHPKVHRNHVRKTSAAYLGDYRRITWHYDYATAAELAKETGRPMFVVFCRAGTVDDPISGEPRCWS